MTDSRKITFENIASQYSTPSYVFDIGELTSRTAMIRDALPNDVSLCFAMKANPFLTKVMGEVTDRLEVCSPGEYEICIRNNIDPEMIVVSGVSKTPSSMERILTYSKGAGIYTIESPLHYEILKDLSPASHRLKVLLRLSNGNQFGMDERTLLGMVKRIQSENVLDIAGIHYYGGTQKTSKKMLHELETLKALGTRLRDEFELNDIELEYGPGLPVEYFHSDNSGKEETGMKESTMKTVGNEDADIGKASACSDLSSANNHDNSQLEELSKQLEGMNMFSHITIELGRFLSAYCGYYLTRIMDSKTTKGANYLITDGGIHQLSYYGQLLGMKTPFIRHIHSKHGSSPDQKDKYTICGSLCTANDVLVKQLELSDPDVGDILIFERCGAYSVTESMALFLSRELPQVLLLEPDNSITILRELTETNSFNSPII